VQNKAAFDPLAADYDAVFSDSNIGLLQRQLVTNYMRPLIEDGSPKDILEVNCGTGVDAAWFLKNNHSVTVTDIAEEMVAAARQRCAAVNSKGEATFKVLSAAKINTHLEPNSCDLIFSNFGGLNCLDPEELKSFMQQAETILRPGGSLVAVVMPRFCVWETLYFLAKFQWGKAFRRMSKKPTAVDLEGEELLIWYYNSTFFKKCAVATKFVHQQAIGFYLPPSYLEPRFVKKKEKLEKWFAKDAALQNRPRFANKSDHCLVHFVKE